MDWKDDLIKRNDAVAEIAKWSIDINNHPFPHNMCAEIIKYYVPSAEPTDERLKEVLRGYILNDLEAADPDYVYDVLVDTLGCTADELRQFGLEFLLEE